MRIAQNIQDFTLRTSDTALAKPAPRWQTVATWAVGISVAVLGLGLAAYTYRNGWFSPSPSDTEDHSLEELEITCTDDPLPDQIPYLQSAINGTIACEEGELEQQVFVCEESANSDFYECALLTNACTSAAEKPRSFILSAGSKALTCAINTGGKAGKAAITTLGSMCYKTGRFCVKGLLAAKVSHETIGTPDPNYHITMYLSRTQLRCLTRDLTLFFRYLGVRI